MELQKAISKKGPKKGPKRGPKRVPKKINASGRGRWIFGYIFGTKSVGGIATTTSVSLPERRGRPLPDGRVAAGRRRDVHVERHGVVEEGARPVCTKWDLTGIMFVQGGASGAQHNYFLAEIQPKK